jgi:hypothetical protein
VTIFDFWYLEEVSTTTFYKWTVGYEGFDPNEGIIFFFDVFAEDGTGRQLTSHYFNISQGVTPESITASSASPTTNIVSSTSLSSTMILPTTTSSSNAFPTPQIPGTSTAQAPNQGSSLSSGAKVGIGVGVSLGTIGIITAIIGITMLMRSKQRGHDLPVPQEAQDTEASDPLPPMTYIASEITNDTNGDIHYDKVRADLEPGEMPTQYDHYELPSAEQN